METMVGCPSHGGTFTHQTKIEECPRCVLNQRDEAVNELTACRALLDSYGFHQVGIHNGITAMQNRILNLESLLKSFD